MIARSRCLLILIPIFFLFRSSSPHVEPRLYSLTGNAQGTTFLIQYYAEHDAVSIDAIHQLLDAVDSSLSQYKSYSLISRFNNTARGVQVDRHLKKMISTSIYFSQLTKGDFDITVKPLSKLWGFNGLAPASLPLKKELRSALKLVGSRHIRLVHDSLIKDDPRVKIDLDGIAQGYTVDLLADYLKAQGITCFLVELGGEIVTSGTKPDGSMWVIGIEGPVSEEQYASIIEKKLLISNKAITTSGSYRKFVKIKDQYFSHIINPKTGKPVNNGVISVTVIADDATTADALDNACMVMGVDKTFELLSRMPELGVYMVYKKWDGSIADTNNTRFQQYMRITE